MRFELPDIYTKIVADVSGIRQKFDQALGQAKSFSTNFEASFKDLGSAATRQVEKMTGAVGREGEKAGKALGEHTIKSLRKSFGAESIFGAFGQILTTGGIAGGLIVAGQMMNRLADSTKNFAIEYSKGGDAARRATAEMLAQIPIVGQIGQAASTIFSVVTGEAQYVAKIQEATTAQIRHMQILEQAHTAVNSFLADAKAGLDHIQAQIDRLGLTGTKLKLFDINQAAIDQISAVVDKMNQAKTQDWVTAKKQEIAGLQDQIAKLTGNLADTPKQISVSAGIGAPGILAPNEKYTEISSQLTGAKQQLAAAQRDLQSKLDMITRGADNQISKIGELSFKQKGREIFQAAADWFTPFIDNAVKARQQVDAQVEAMRKQIAATGKNPIEQQIMEFSNLPAQARMTLPNSRDWPAISTSSSRRCNSPNRSNHGAIRFNIRLSNSTRPRRSSKRFGTPGR